MESYPWLPQTKKTLDTLEEEIDLLSEQIERCSDLGLSTFELVEKRDEKMRTVESLRYVIYHDSGHPSPSLGQ